MDPPAWATCAGIGLLTIVLILLTTRHRARRLRLPPGPKAWPIIGNFNLIGPLPHRSMHELSKKYGPIMMLRLGSIPVVVGSTVEMAKLFLKTHDEAFAGRPNYAAGKYIAYEFTDLTWAEYGPYWRQLRKLCLTELFSIKRLKEYEYIRSEEFNSLLNGLLKLSGKPMVLKDHLSDFSLNVISRMVMGKTYLTEEEGYLSVAHVELKKMIGEFFVLNGVFNLGDWIWLMKFFDVHGYVKRMKVFAKTFGKFADDVLDEHNARREKEKEKWVAKDMVDVLLEHVHDLALQVKIERDGLKGIIQDLISGGSDSPAVILEWAMSELIRKPETMMKATKELECVIGKQRWVQEDDIQNLPYLRAIIKETMRLHPLAFLLSHRQSREQVRIQGYDIPKGSVVFVNTFTTQRDPNVYERPEEFWPERFIGRDIDMKGQNFELLPFGSGRRMCPGYNLGLKVIEPTLANLLHGFTWKLPVGVNVEDVDMEEKFGLSNPKKISLVVCAEPRLAPHLYQNS